MESYNFVVFEKFTRTYYHQITLDITLSAILSLEITRFEEYHRPCNNNTPLSLWEVPPPPQKTTSFDIPFI